jgi:hypothetical protein
MPSRFQRRGGPAIKEMVSDAYVGGRFANNAAKNWGMTLADTDEHNHRFPDPGSKRRRKILSSLRDHAGSPVDLRVSPRYRPQWRHGRFIAQAKWNICSNLHT